jgi:hypothetical protein
MRLIMRFIIMIKIEDIAEDKIITYDIETDGLHAPYCKLEMISYQLGLGPESEPKLVKLSDKTECEQIKRWLSDPEMIKVSFNGTNFDDIVLMRYGFYVQPNNRHDMYLALKTVNPGLPSHSLKFANWWYFGDWHEPQRQMERWLLTNKEKRHDMYKAPEEIGRLLLACARQRSCPDALEIQRICAGMFAAMRLAMATLARDGLFAGRWLNPTTSGGRCALEWSGRLY